MKENLACSTKYILHLRSSPKFNFCSVRITGLTWREEARSEKWERVKFEDSGNSSRWSSLDREQSSVSGKMAQGLERQGSVTRTAGRSPPEMLREPFSSFCAHWSVTSDDAQTKDFESAHNRALKNCFNGKKTLRKIPFWSLFDKKAPLPFHRRPSLGPILGLFSCLFMPLI